MATAQFNILGAHEIRMSADNENTGNPLFALGVANNGITQTVEHAWRTASPDCQGPGTLTEAFAVGTRVSLAFTLHKIHWSNLFGLLNLFNRGTSEQLILPSIGTNAKSMSNELSHRVAAGLGGNPIRMSIKAIHPSVGLHRVYLAVIPDTITINIGATHSTVEVNLMCLPYWDATNTRWEFWEPRTADNIGDTTNLEEATIMADGAHEYEWGEAGSLTKFGCPTGGTTVQLTYNWSPANPDDTGPETDQDMIFTGLQAAVTPAGGLEYYDIDEATKFEWLNNDVSTNPPTVDGGILTGIGLGVATPTGLTIGRQLYLKSLKEGDKWDWDFPITYPQDQCVTQMPVGHSMFSATWVVQHDYQGTNVAGLFFQRIAG